LHERIRSVALGPIQIGSYCRANEFGRARLDPDYVCHGVPTSAMILSGGDGGARAVAMKLGQGGYAIVR
jgi:hypothetical protein